MTLFENCDLSDINSNCRDYGSYFMPTLITENNELQIERERWKKEKRGNRVGNKAEYIRVAQLEIPQIIKEIENRRKEFAQLIGDKYSHPLVVELDGLCGSGKTSIYSILVNMGLVATDDHNEDPEISAVCFAKKEKSQTREEKARAGDEGAFKLELIKWLKIYDQLLARLEGIKFVNLSEDEQQKLITVYSTRGVVTLIAHAFARQARNEEAFPQEIAKWMLNLLNGGAVPLPAFFGFISPGDIRINQNRIMQRQAERILGHPLRRQDIANINLVLEKINSVTLYREEDQRMHNALLVLLEEMMNEEGFYPKILNSGNVSSECIAREIQVSSQRLFSDPENSKVIGRIGRVFIAFLEKVASGEINFETIKKRLEPERLAFTAKFSALEYFNQYHTNNYGFDWLEFERNELACANPDKYKSKFPEQYNLLKKEVTGGLDIVIPYRNGSVENLEQTLTNLARSFNQLLSYLHEEDQNKVKLNIIIVDQESDTPVTTQKQKFANLLSENINKGIFRLRVVKTKKHPKYNFDVDACRAEGVKYTELQNTLFLDHEVFIHPETLVRFYKIIAKTKFVQGLEAITCCSSTVDKVAQYQLKIALINQRSGETIEVTKDWMINILEVTNYLRNIGGLWTDEYGSRPIYNFLRPGIHLLPTTISRHAFTTNFPIGGYGKEQIKYLEIFITNNGKIFVIVDPNPNTRVYTIKEEGLEDHQKNPDKQQELNENAKYEVYLLENTTVLIVQLPDGTVRFQVAKQN